MTETLEKRLPAYTGEQGKTRTLQYTNNGTTTLRIVNNRGKTLYEFSGEIPQAHFRTAYEIATNADPTHILALLKDPTTPYNPTNTPIPEEHKPIALREATRKEREQSYKKRRRK